jgi:hypothetical protein
MTTPSSDPAAVVQRQFEAYNAHDLDALLATYADDAQHFEHPATLLASGKEQLRGRFAARFEDPRLQATLVRRMVAGNVVVDHEEITCTFPEGIGRIELVAIYEVAQGRIARAWFIRGERNLEDV